MGITQNDVAKAANVSHALVSLVMRDSPNVSPAKREAVLRAAADLGYRRNTHAAQLASRRSMILGTVLTELQNPFYSQVLAAAENEAEKRGYGILPTLGDMDVEQERERVNRLLGHRVDGIVLLGTSLSAEEVRQLTSLVPLVTLGRAVSGVDSVEVDGRAGASLAVDHLIELGHQSIAFLDGGEAPGAAARRRGYVESMCAAGLRDEVCIEDGGSSELGGMTATLRLLRSDSPPTAVFAHNDLSATGALAASRELSISVPGQLSVVGFDDSPLSSLRYIDLTTVAQPRSDLAHETIASLVDRIDQPDGSRRSKLVTPHLVVRSSTSRPAQT